jgi:hypothetical protein
MFKRLKRIEEKLDRLIEAEKITARMVADLVEQIDDRRQAGETRKKALADYVGSVTGILEAKGAPPQFVNSIKQLFDKGFNGEPKQ